MRIVTLLPSATEIVCLLDLQSDLVGVTHECDYPSGISDLPKVTRTRIPASATSHDIDQQVREQRQTQNALYTLEMPVLESLKPDLIVTQTLCDVCAVAESEVRDAVRVLPGSPLVVNLAPTSLDDVYVGIEQVAAATDRMAQAATAIAQLRARVELVHQRAQAITRRPRVMLLEWIDPPFSAGHWSPTLVRLAGGHEVIGTAGRPSRAVAWQEVLDADPEIIVVACCGFDIPRTLVDLPILRGYPGWQSLQCVTTNRVFVADGSAYFSRPGPRLVDSLEILAHAIHPQIHPLPPGLEPARHAHY